MTIESDTLAMRIAARLGAEAETLRRTFGAPSGDRVRCCAVDDVFSPAIWKRAFADLPPLSEMTRLKSVHERKYVSARFDALKPSVKRLVAAFNTQIVADAVAEIMQADRLETDGRLYNGGVTIMAPGDYMRPHLDNSHNYDRSRRREVVLLYYISDYWRDSYGGELELWSEGFTHAEAIGYRANRLVIMETTDSSWHSVRPITGAMPRANIIAYFYAPAEIVSKSRLTRFTAWPHERLDAALCDVEFALRSLADGMGMRKLRPNRHVYRAAPERTLGG